MVVLEMSYVPLVLVSLLVFPCPTVAQRPDEASVCDYYAEQLYGKNDSDSQHKLVQHIVALAFEGGSGLDNVSSELTGILRPGKFQDVDVDLRSWFNGSRASTNVNNAPIAINWLDDGGTEPLSAFLTGKTEEVMLGNTTNQGHLFGNFFVAFSRVFSCSFPFPPLPHRSGPATPAYVHKFMNLDWNQLSYFIHQLTQAGQYYGFSQQDSQTISTRLNSLYNVRCAPPVTFNPQMGPQLLSLCQNPTCPLAAPVSDCAAYENLTAQGIVDSSPTTILTTAIITETPDSSSTSPPETPTPTPAPSHSDSLGAGAIAGIAIGSAAVVALAGIAAAVLCYKRRKSRKGPEQSLGAQQPQMASTSAWVGSQQAMSPTSPWGDGNARMSYGATLSEMGTTAYSTQGDNGSRVASPERNGHSPYQYQSYQTMGPHNEIGVSHHPAAEMDASEMVQRGHEYAGPPKQ